MINIRLGYFHNDSETSKEFVDMVKKNDGCCDTIWFEGEYGYPSIEKQSKIVDKMIELSKMYNDAGIEVALQISNTLGGHGSLELKKDFSSENDLNFENAVDQFGESHPHMFCHNGKNFRDYIQQTIREYARLKPKTMWIDDDIRRDLPNFKHKYCYCDECIKRFNEKYNSNFSREELVYEINRGDISWRRKFTEFIREGMADFAEMITKTAVSVYPDVRMGLQYGTMTNYFGNNGEWTYIYDAMKNNSNHSPAGRTGGGGYYDNEPYGFVDMATTIEHAISCLPKYVDFLVPEIENFPDVVYGIVPHSTMLKADLCLAYGCTGLSFAIFRKPYEPAEYHEEFLKLMKVHRCYWEKLIAVNKVTKPTGGGIVPVANDVGNNFENDFEYCDLPRKKGTGMRYMGIAETHVLDKADYMVLTYDTVPHISDEDIEKLLNQNVLTDGKAIELLQKRGFGDKMGIEIECVPTDEELFEEVYDNGLSYWYPKYASAQFFAKPYIIKSNSNVVKAYDKLRGFKTGKILEGSAAVVRIKSTGAKWGIIGFAPWINLVSAKKRNQLQAIADELSNNKLPVIVENTTPLVIKPRVDEKGRIACVTILNASIAPTKEIKVRLRTTADCKLSYENAYTSNEVVGEYENGELKVTLPPFTRGWEISTLFVKYND